MAKLEIIGVPGSTYTRAVLMACQEKGVPYELTAAPPHAPALNAIHPFGKIPVMRHGDLELCESKAIATYIDGTFDGPDLIPDDPRLAAQVEQWVSLVNTMMDRPMVRDYVLKYVFAKDGKPDRVAIDAAVETMKTQFPVLDAAVAKTGYLVGDSFTFADMNLMPILAYLSQFPESAELLKSSKNLSAYFQRHSTRESFKKTVPPRP
jgi:glutathione S-transferase